MWRYLGGGRKTKGGAPCPSPSNSLLFFFGPNLHFLTAYSTPLLLRAVPQSIRVLKVTSPD